MTIKKEQADLFARAKILTERGGYYIPLHFPFHLPGKTLPREVPFLGGLELTERWKMEFLGGDENLKRKYELQRQNAREITKTLLDLVKGSLSVESASRTLGSVARPGSGWPEIAKEIGARMQEEPDIRGLLENLLQFGELRFANLAKYQADFEKILDCVTTLAGAAVDRGDGFATERLFAIAKYAVEILESLSEQRPELLRPLARKSFTWPVMASVEPGWMDRAQERLQNKLQFGEETIHGRLDKAKAYQLENISRRYARGIVETLEINRLCLPLAKERSSIIRWKMKNDGIPVLVPRVPGWVREAAKLLPFCADTAEDWLEVGMKMLKEQRPTLPGHRDWARIARQWENRGEKPTRGRIWNSIKDALRSPVRTIARARQREGVTQK